MHYLLLGLGVLVLCLALAKAFVNANPQTIAANSRKIGGIAALFGAVLFTVTGRFPVAVPLLFLAISLLSRGVSFGFPGNSQKTAGQSSTVKTAFLEMALDHDSGEMRGFVLRGQFQGRALSSLTRDEAFDLLQECHDNDPQSLQLLMAYLDTQHPGWRDDVHDQTAYTNPDTGHGPSASGPMSRDEAYKILGLGPEATSEEIHRAHRNLMKKFHPDQGGSTYLASRINEAKDLLLGQ